MSVHRCFLAALLVLQTASASASRLDYEDLISPQERELLLRGQQIDHFADPETLSLYRAASSALEGADPEAALAAAQALTDRAPDRPQGWYMLGLAWANLGENAKALEALDRAADLFRNNASALIVKGDLLLAAGDREAARDAFRAAAETDPSDWRAHDSLGKFALDVGDRAAAHEHLERAVETAPDDVFDPRVRLASLLISEGALDRGEDILEAFSAENPAHSAAQVALGRLAFTRGDNLSARAYFDRAVSLQPENPGLRVFKARAELNAGLVDEAMDTLRTARIDMPGWPVLAMELGSLHGVVRDYDAALATFAEGAREWPDRPGFHRGASRAAYRLAQWDTALFHSEAVMSLQDTVSADHLWHGAVLEKLDRREDARAAYAAAVESDPGNWVALNNLAALSVDTDPDRAVELATAALDESGGNVAVQATLAWALFRSGNPTRGETLLREVVARAPDSALFRYRLGLILLETDRSADGRTEIAAALDLDPEFRFAAEARELLSRD